MYWKQKNGSYVKCITETTQNKNLTFLVIFFSELEIALREKSLAFSNLDSVFAVDHDHWVKWISSSVSVISVMSVTVQ